MKVYYEFPTKDGPTFHWKWTNQDEYEAHFCGEAIEPAYSYEEFKAKIGKMF